MPALPLPAGNHSGETGARETSGGGCRVREAAPQFVEPQLLARMRLFEWNRHQHCHVLRPKARAPRRGTRKDLNARAVNRLNRALAFSIAPIPACGVFRLTCRVVHMVHSRGSQSAQVPVLISSGRMSNVRLNNEFRCGGIVVGPQMRRRFSSWQSASNAGPVRRPAPAAGSTWTVCSLATARVADV